MNRILLGNIICLVGAAVMALAGLIKGKRKFLLGQSISAGFFGAGALVLGGVSGFIVDVATIIRNLLSIRWRLNRWIKLAFIVVLVGCNYFFSDNGLIGWLPVIGGCVFTWFIDTENMILLKIVCVVTQIAWLIFDYSIQSYTSSAFDVLGLITNTVSVVSLVKDRKNTPLM